MRKAKSFRVPGDPHGVYFMWFRHWRTGQIVRRPNGRPFRIDARR